MAASLNVNEQSKEQVERLEQIFKSLDESSKGKKCQGLAGLVEEAEDLKA